MLKSSPKQHRKFLNRWSEFSSRLRRKSVRARILMLLLVAFLPALITEMAVYWHRFDARRRDEFQAEVEIARATAKTFESYLDDIFDQGRLLAVFALTTLPGDDKPLAQAFAAVQQSHPEVKEIRLVTPDGTVAFDSIGSSPIRNVADQPYFQAIVSGQEQYVSDLFLSRTLLAPIFVLACGNRNNEGKLLLMVTCHVDPEILERGLEVRRLSRGSHAIIDRNGRLVFRSPPIELPWEERSWLQAYPEIRAALQGREVAAVRQSSYDDAERVTAFTPIPLVGWVAVAGRPLAEILTPIIIALGGQAGLLLMIITTAFIVALAIARSITKPLEKMRLGAVGLGDGSHSGLIAVKGPTELQELTQAFNDMSMKIVQREAELGQARDLLEKRVRERTAALAAATKTMRQYAEELEIRNKDLEDFAFLTAHDLQEPLRKIQVFSSLLQTRYGSSLEPAASEHLDRLQNAAQKMRDLIHALHHFFVVTKRGRAAEPIDLNEVVNELRGNFQARMDAIGGRIDQEPLPVVEGDRIQIRELFFQLIDNGLKFPQPGSKPMVRIFVESAPPSGGELYHRIAVEDNGIGFDERYADRIFVPLEKIHTASEYGGVGIGLAICKKIVEYHHGAIMAVSEPGKCAKFVVTLPAKARLATKPEPPNAG